MHTHTIEPAAARPLRDPRIFGVEPFDRSSKSNGRSDTPRTSPGPSQPTLLHLGPPYERLLPCRQEAADLLELPPGSVLILDLAAEPRDWGALNDTMRRLRSEAPLLPLALRIDAGRVNVLNAAIQIAQMPVRAVIGGEGYAHSLRRQLTRPADLPGDVVDWLSLRGIRFSPAVRHLLHGIFALAPHSPTVAPLLVRIGTSESSARFRLQKKCLPPPGRWLQVARALTAALHLQARPDRALLPLALSLGYADHSALSHLLGRAFGSRPSEIRERLGWEWLPDRWLRVNVRGFQRSE